MGERIVLGICKGESLLDLEGLFRVVRLDGGYSKGIVQVEASRLGFIGVIISDDAALLLTSTGTLRTNWNKSWLEGLIKMVSGVDPLKAEEIAERVFLRHIFAGGLKGFLELETNLEILKRHAELAEAQSLRNQAFVQAAEWRSWKPEFEDIEGRIRNLQLTLSRFAVRLGNRWLFGEQDG